MMIDPLPLNEAHTTADNGHVQAHNDLAHYVNTGIAGVPGPSGITVVNHGTDATVVRPAGAPLVYWVGTVKPNNGVPTDFWYNG